MRVQGAIRAEFDLDELVATVPLSGRNQGSSSADPFPDMAYMAGPALNPIWFDSDCGLTQAQQADLAPAILQHLACRVDLRLLKSLMMYRSGESVHVVGVLEDGLPPSHVVAAHQRNHVRVPSDISEQVGCGSRPPV